MRKTSYFVTLGIVGTILFLNIVSSRRPDWLVVRYEEILYTKVTLTYGLTQLCKLTVSEIPGPSNGGNISYRKYECRKFPDNVTDHCEKENNAFCAAWTSAGYLHQIAMGFAAVALLTILFGVSTHSRRRRIWRAVAGLVLLQAACQVATFTIITELYHASSYSPFERARPGINFYIMVPDYTLIVSLVIGTAYVLHVLAWISSIMVAFGVLLTGISAGAGHRWAAGNHAYNPI